MKRKLRSCLKKYYPLIEVLAKSTPEQTKLLIQLIDEDSIHFMSECVYNTLNNLHTQLNLKTRSELKDTIMPDKAKLRRLIKSKKNIKVRRRILGQTGGSLSLILSAALPLITHLLA